MASKTADHEEERQKRLTRRRVLAGTGAAGAAALAGCSGGGSEGGGSTGSGDGTNAGGGSGDGTTISLLTTYTSPASKESYNATTNAFQESNPDVSVNMGYTNWENIYSRLVQAANTGDWPDMAFFLDNELCLILKDQGFTSDPEPVVNQITEVAGDIADDVPEVHYKDKDGSYYTIQTNNQTPLPWYRTDVMEEVGLDETPQGWNEELEYVKGAHEADNDLYGTSLSTAKNTYASDIFFVRLRNAGGNALDPEKNVVFDQQVTRDVLEHYKELAQYSAPGSEGFSYGDAYTNYATDKVAHCTYWGRTLINVVDQTPEITEYVINGHSPQPDNDIADPDEKGVMSGDAGQLTKEAANPETATAWFKEYLKPEHFVEEYMVGTPGNTTPIYENHQEAWENFDIWTEVENGEHIRDTLVKDARSAYPKCRGGPEFPAFPELADIIRTPVMSDPSSKYFADQIDVDEAAKQMQQKAEQAVANY